jgi:hypothetical protein
MALGWSRRDRRALVAGSVVLSLLVIVRNGVPAVRERVSTGHAAALDALRDASIASEDARLLPLVSESLGVRRERLAALDTTLLRGTTPAEAGAALASVLSDYADDRSVRLAFVQVRPDSASRNGLARVAVRASGIGDIAGVTRLLNDIESGAPLLAVRELSITQPEPAAPDGRAEALRFEVLVEGLARVDAARKMK